ncbi:uncharacterized protein LOC108607693 isoform X2 [Drosophila busckii]|uniref:uncharacterized protein LOC108607693 isoform X2 n=1 Tax=Drosophila busckii TaxID=30019 RepID=UPI00083F0B27|nr:uncharacterized protein LOC108607693 isoform X2 [Drosophila busckii]
MDIALDNLSDFSRVSDTDSSGCSFERRVNTTRRSSESEFGASEAENIDAKIKTTTIGKTFTDEDYIKGTIKAEVPQRSLFTYVKHRNKVWTVESPAGRTPLSEVVEEMIRENKGAYLKDPFREDFIFAPKDVPADGFESIDKWLRLKTCIAPRNLPLAMQAAKHLQMDVVEEHCWQCLDSKQICNRLAFELYLIAVDLEQLDKVRTLMLRRVQGYFLALVGTQQFLDLRLRELRLLLSSDALGVNSEIEVFYAAMRWVSANSDTRLYQMKEVLSCVRFPYMPMAFLFGLRTIAGELDERAIIGPDNVLMHFLNDPDTPKLLMDAVAYISVHFLEKIGDVGDVSNKSVILPRHWIYDPKCSYHMETLIYPYQHHFTLNEFIDYIRSIQHDWQDDKAELRMREVAKDSAFQLLPLFQDKFKKRDDGGDA